MLPNCTLQLTWPSHSLGDTQLNVKPLCRHPTQLLESVNGTSRSSLAAMRSVRACSRWPLLNTGQSRGPCGVSEDYRYPAVAPSAMSIVARRIECPGPNCDGPVDRIIARRHNSGRWGNLGLPFSRTQRLSRVSRHSLFTSLHVARGVDGRTYSASGRRRRTMRFISLSTIWCPADVPFSLPEPVAIVPCSRRSARLVGHSLRGVHQLSYCLYVRYLSS
jgi:hypothetical protein